MNRDDLYGLPLDRFTDERNALVKRLKQGGQRDEAASVSKLRKPSVAAWAVNQLVRTQRSDVAALFDAGDALQRAQADLLAGRGDPDELRRAVDTERAAVRELTERARGLLSSQGQELSQSSLESVSETLHAAALDQEARQQLRDGRLERELRHIGLGAMTGAAAPSRRAGRSSRRGGTQPKPERDQAAKRKAARQAEAAARHEHDRAQRELEATVKQRDRAAATLRDAEQLVASARERAEKASERHQQAKRTLDEL